MNSQLIAGSRPNKGFVVSGDANLQSAHSTTTLISMTAAKNNNDNAFHLLSSTVSATRQVTPKALDIA